MTNSRKNANARRIYAAKKARENATQAEAARQETSANHLFVQAVVAVKRLREYTPWVHELFPQSESRKEGDYLNTVLDHFPCSYPERADEIARLRARLAFTEEIVHVFFRRIITENFAHECGRGDFDRDFGPDRPFTAPVAYALEHADAYGLTVADIRVGGRNSGHVNGGAK